MSDSHLPYGQQDSPHAACPDKTALLAAAICSTGPVALISLLASSAIVSTSAGIFTGQAASHAQIVHYYFLVLLTDRMQRPLHEWQDMMEGRCGKIAAVTIIALEKDSFYGWLQQGHYFALSVYRSGRLLYGSFDEQVAKSFSNQTPEPTCCASIQLASSFLAGAELYILRLEATPAAFMLHQAAEQALHAFIKTTTGYHPTTHNIERLLKLSGLVTPQPEKIFLPHNSQREKQLLKVLQQAYSDGRYQPGYQIDREALLLLTQRVRQLLVLVKTYTDKPLYSKTEPQPSMHPLRPCPDV